MSLINQMLKDLEQRGAGSNDAEKMITSSPSDALQPAVVTPYMNQHYQAKHGVPFLKISGLVVLLAGGAYLWVQSAPALSHSIDHLKVQATPQAAMIHADSVEAAKPVEEIKAIAQTADSALLPLFENALKYTPIEYKPTASQTQVNKLEKYPQKDKVIANIMPAELVANNLGNTNQATKTAEPVKSVDIVEPANTSVVSDNSAVSAKLVVAAKSAAHSSNSSIVKQISTEQKSGNLYRQALANLQQGRVAEAQSNLAQSLEVYPANQEARQTLAGLLLDNNRNDEARATLAAGLAIAPEQTNFRIALARLQIELGDKSAALTIMEQGLAYANNNADYQSFLATLLQRANRHDEAISHYKTALSMNASSNNSSSANSLVGLGISLQATGKLENAQEAFTRAQSVATLSPELAQFIDQQLKQINQRLQNSASK
ncbi:tetratricopeptide repeat protein [Methylotenera sp.]|uniref:tetratricopeptide repeat protein n=1 Tax=Methylotenera sp. TaxID=2051956 RepID=UPI0024876561|nr:tetratricopeptide repeat protein [Methylotenera sp.]MDI1299666.1 tetratricopeptide repeat protein [Methylotenera sp.]